MKINLFFLVILVFCNHHLSAQNFITRWDLTLDAGSGTEQISFNVITTGSVNYTWTTVPAGTSGSGTFMSSSSSGSQITISGLPTGATIDLSINPTNFKSFYIINGPDRKRLIDVKQWGSTAWSILGSTFAGCSNLNISASDVPNLSNVTSMRDMFRGCSILNSPSNIGTWNTAAVTDMAGIFAGANAFNQDISSWNTASVTTMSEMFFNATAFNQNLGLWNTSVVMDMGYMFFRASAFNQPIGSWNTAAVKDMRYMFFEANSFNQPIANWNTVSVTTMSNMFENNFSFNQPIGSWNLSSLTNMRQMFAGTFSFNQPIGTWNTSSVTFMERVFFGATIFNQNIGNWNITNTTDMESIFFNCGINQANYDAILIAWNNAGYINKNLGNLTPLKYCLGAAARTNLINNKGWTISGDTELCSNAEINIKGNNISIANGDITPSLNDHTDYGTTPVLFGIETKTFTIENLGTSTLNLTGGSFTVTLSGINASDFGFSGFPSRTAIPPGDSATFTIFFNPNSHGLKKATINIPNDDSNENPYTFEIQGFGCGSLNISTPISTGTVNYNAVDITVNSLISNANVALDASKFISLLPGFLAENTVFTAGIGAGCN